MMSDPRIIAAFITGFFTLLAVWYGHYLGQRKVDILHPHSKDSFEKALKFTKKKNQTAKITRFLKTIRFPKIRFPILIWVACLAIILLALPIYTYWGTIKGTLIILISSLCFFMTSVHMIEDGFEGIIGHGYVIVMLGAVILMADLDSGEFLLNDIWNKVWQKGKPWKVFELLFYPPVSVFGVAFIFIKIGSSGHVEEIES